MKLFAYSNELIAFVDAKWITVKFVLFGILIGSIVFFTFFTLNHTARKIFRSDLANISESENFLLQEQMNHLAPKIYTLKMQSNYLMIRSHKLDKLLFRTILMSGVDSGITIEAKTFKFQSLLFASKVSNP